MADQLADLAVQKHGVRMQGHARAAATAAEEASRVGQGLRRPGSGEPGAGATGSGSEGSPDGTGGAAHGLCSPHNCAFRGNGTPEGEERACNAPG